MSILSKRNIFYTLKQQYFFISFCSFEGVRYFWVELFIFFSSCSLQLTNSCFASLKEISDRDLQIILHPSMNYWFQYCDLHSALVKYQRSAEECTENLGDTFHCRQTYINKNLVFCFLNYFLCFNWQSK